MKTSKKRNHDEVNYWQSSTDVLAALLMIVLLIMMILLLYLVKKPEEENVDKNPGDKESVHTQDNDDEHNDTHDKDHDYNDDKDKEHDKDNNNPGGGGGGDEGDGGDAPNIYDGTGPGDGAGKTALYAMVVDGETHQTIKEEGVTFELQIYNSYKKEWQLSVLNTYYPEKIEFRNYETTNEGIFYLPEKIQYGLYKFVELTAPYGYDSIGELEFEVKEARDWNEPIIVTVPLTPAKNIIRVQMKDQETKQPIAGGSYYVYAAEDVATKDGTVRYKKGELCDEIVVDENGYGESIELFLGNYELVQNVIPEFYAAEDKPIACEVTKKVKDTLPELHNVLCNKTTFTINLHDELYNNIPLKDNSFSISYFVGNNKVDTVKTNEIGEIKMTDLAKSTTYHVKQLSVSEGYIMNPNELEIKVDEKGRIDGDVTPIYNITNRIMRTKVGVKDIILKNFVADQNVTIFYEDGSVYQSWDTSSMANVVEGIQPGNYYILINGRTSSRKDITVHDTEKLQEFYISMWTSKSIAALVVILLLLILLLVLLVWYLVKHREERKERKEAKKAEKEAKKAEKAKAKEANK